MYVFIYFNLIYYYYYYWQTNQIKADIYQISDI